MNLALQKLHILKACAYICYFKLQTLSVIVHGRKIQLYALTVFFLLLLQVNKTHHSEDEMPQVSFFTVRNKASCSTVDLPSSSSAQSSTKETTLNSISGAEEKELSHLILHLANKERESILESDFLSLQLIAINCNNKTLKPACFPLNLALEIHKFWKHTRHLYLTR